MPKLVLCKGFLFRHSYIFSTLVIFLAKPLNSNIETTNKQISPLLQFQKEASKFIVENIVSKHLPGCIAILIADFKPSYKYQNTEFNSEISTSLLHLINYNKMPAAVLAFSFNLTISQTSTLLRFSSAFKSVISIISTSSPQYFNIFKNITSPDIEFTKRDEDYYIFVTESEQIGKSLLYSQIVLLIRYKIVIYPTNETRQKANINGVGVSFSIKTVCIYCSNEISKILDLPYSASQKFENLSISQIFPDSTRNMQKHTIKISAPTMYLASYEMEKVNGEYRNKRGIHTLTFDIVAEKINMTYILQPCTKFGNIPQGATGILLPNGTWAGCMGDVIRGTSDMALSMSPDDKRFHYVQFSSALEYSYITYTTSKPMLLYSWRAIFTAFNTKLWAFLMASILVTTAIIHFFDHFLGFDRDSSVSGLNRLSRTGLYLMGYVVGQDAPLPKSFASKWAYIAWLFGGFIIGSIYQCSLQALIVSPGLEFIPETFSQLVNSHYKWGASNGFRNGLGEQLFKDSDNPVMRKIYHGMEGNKDGKVCTQRALSKYACFNWEMMEQFLLQTEFADESGNHPFQMAKDMTFFVSLNFITRKRELYRSHFNEFISRSFDTGLVKQAIKLDWRRHRLDVLKARKERKLKDPFPQINTSSPKSFRLSNVKGCFFVLLCGLSASIVAFLCEFLKFPMRIRVQTL